MFIPKAIVMEEIERLRSRENPFPKVIRVKKNKTKQAIPCHSTHVPNITSVKYQKQFWCLHQA